MMILSRGTQRYISRDAATWGDGSVVRADSRDPATWERWSKVCLPAL